MAYTAKCTGVYIGQFTMYDPVEFNRYLNEGYTVREATGMLKKSDIMIGSAFYPLYSYTVDGVEYVRASYRLHEHFGRSIGNANVRMRGTRCTVCYDPENPGDAVVEDKTGAVEPGDVEPDAPKKASLKWLLIAAGALVVIEILRAVAHAIIFMG